MGPLCFSACNRPLGDRLRFLTKGAVCEGPSPNGTTKEKAISRPGRGDVGSIQTYAWTVPAVIDSSVWVRVRMDNSATDYYDVSLIELLLVFGETCP